VYSRMLTGLDNSQINGLDLEQQVVA